MIFAAPCAVATSFRLTVSLALLLAAAPMATAQTLEERAEYMRMKRARQGQVQAAPQPTGPSVSQLLGQRMDFAVTDVGFQEALETWSMRTGVKLLVNWRQMENDGVDPDVPVNVQLEQLPAARVLLILLDVGSTEFRFIAEIEPWGMQIRTREQANRDVHVKVYDVRDLVMEIPSFTDAPSFELAEVLENSGEGGGGGLFDDQDDDTDDEPTAQDRGDALADTIRQTVEPDVWRVNGGEFSAMHFTDGRLIVRAPLYVHGQIAGSALIGTPDTPTGYNFRTRNGGLRSVPNPQAGPIPGQPHAPASTPSNGVGGVAPNPQGVGGVAGK